jgi:hypothetical protein
MMSDALSLVVLLCCIVLAAIGPAPEASRRVSRRGRAGSDPRAESLT